MSRDEESPIAAIANAVVPLVIVFFAAYALKRARLLAADDGRALLRVVYFVGIPPLIFLSIMKVDIDASLLRLCLFVPFTTGIMMVIVLGLRRSALREVRATAFGPLLVGTVVMNTGFLLPFVERIAGAEGLARLVIIDTSNAIMTFSVVYVVLLRVAQDTPDVGFVVRRLVLSPPLWALVTAIIAKVLELKLPVVLWDTFEIGAALVGTAVVVALGLLFEASIRGPRLLFLALVLRFGLGLALGLAFVRIMELDGLDAGIVMFASVAPLGMNSIMFAELERLDVDFAASLVSISLVIAIVASPLTAQFLK